MKVGGTLTSLRSTAGNALPSAKDASTGEDPKGTESGPGAGPGVSSGPCTNAQQFRVGRHENTDPPGSLFPFAWLQLAPRRRFQ